MKSSPDRRDMKEYREFLSGLSTRLLKTWCRLYRKDIEKCDKHPEINRKGLQQDLRAIEGVLKRRLK